MKEIQITDKITIRHVKLSDAQVFFDAEQDDEAKKNFMTTPTKVSQIEDDIKEEILEYKKEKPNSEKFTILYEGKVSGWITLNQLNLPFFEHRGKVDFCLHSDYRSKGIMNEVLKAVAKYAFKKYKLKRLEIWTRTYNKAVKKLAEYAGFEFEGILRKNKCKNGEYLDDVLFAMVR